MNSIEKITLRITKEAEEYAEEILQKARERAQIIISDAEKNAEKIINEGKEKAERESRAIINRAASSADILERNILLDAKSVIIDGIYQRAESAACQTDGDRYPAFLTASIDKAISFLTADGDCDNARDKEQADGVFLLTLNQRDKALFGKELLLYACSAVKKYGKKAALAEVAGDFSGGLKLRHGNVEANLTLSALIKKAREATEARVYAILFRQEDYAQ